MRQLLLQLKHNRTSLVLIIIGFICLAFPVLAAVFLASVFMFLGFFLFGVKRELRHYQSMKFNDQVYQDYETVRVKIRSHFNH